MIESRAATLIPQKAIREPDSLFSLENTQLLPNQEFGGKMGNLGLAELQNTTNLVQNPEYRGKQQKTFDQGNLPIEERLAMLSLSLTTISYLRARHQYFPLTELELQNPDQLEKDEEDKRVADHEMGHRLAALSLGWGLVMTTVVPGENYRGVNIATPNGSKTHAQLMEDAVCIAVAGYMAMEMMGNADPHHGAGSDKAQAKRMARILAVYEYDDPNMEDTIISSAESRAPGLISSGGNLEYDSHNLALRKTI